MEGNHHRRRCLTAFCALLFPYALGLPLQMLPKFMIR